MGIKQLEFTRFEAIFGANREKDMTNQVGIENIPHTSPV